jgi:hypothetical protein
MEPEIEQAVAVVEKLGTESHPIVTKIQEVMLDLKFPAKEVYAKADECYNEIHKIWSQGEKARLDFTAPLNLVIKKLNLVFKAKLDPLEATKRKLKGKMDEYATSEMMWKRREEAKVAEAKRKADEEALAAATKLADEGKAKEADVVLNKAIADVPKPVVGATDESQSFTKTVWKAEVTDLKAFLHAVADHPEIYYGYVTVEEGQLNRFAQRTKGTESIPGVTVREQASVGVRA